MDCLFMQRRKKWSPSQNRYSYGFFCDHANKEIHEIKNEDCWVLSDEYPYGKLEVK